MCNACCVTAPDLVFSYRPILFIISQLNAVKISLGERKTIQNQLNKDINSNVQLPSVNQSTVFMLCCKWG